MSGHGRAPARFFATPQELAAWFAEHHTSAAELWVGFHKVGSGRASVTWPQSVDEALCVGWIDGVRKRIDDAAYEIRFTPRRRGSIWSTVNVRRFGELQAQGRVALAGATAFALRQENRTGVYSHENRPAELPAEYEATLHAVPAAWAYWTAAAPSYRRAVTWWLIGAKQETTRQRRLAQLIEDCAAGREVGLMRRPG
jgi:uncharacterized protein YdeI (YjbR/CyaY-like superfamily)